MFTSPLLKTFVLIQTEWISLRAISNLFFSFLLILLLWLCLKSSSLHDVQKNYILLSTGLCIWCFCSCLWKQFFPPQSINHKIRARSKLFIWRNRAKCVEKNMWLSNGHAPAVCHSLQYLFDYTRLKDSWFLYPSAYWKLENVTPAHKGFFFNVQSVSVL